LLTIAYQFPVKRFEGFINNKTIVGVIPKWNFFAPTPGVHNFHLLYRDQLGNGSLGLWKEVRFGKGKTYLSWVWNPGKRIIKAAFDIVVTLAKIIEETKEREYIQVSVPYLTILNYISNLPASNLVAARQFALMQTSISDEKPRLLFLSNLHRL